MPLNEMYCYLYCLDHVKLEDRWYSQSPCGVFSVGLSGFLVDFCSLRNIFKVNFYSGNNDLTSWRAVNVVLKKTGGQTYTH